MKVAILGMDGYLGWALTQKLLDRKHDVVGLDNFSRRRMVKEVGSQSVISIASMRERLEAVREVLGKEVEFEEGDVLNYRFIEGFIKKHRPDSIVNFAQQPSPHYSMMSPERATFTQYNNICGGLNLLWAVRKVDHEIPILTLGTLGEWSCYDDKTEILTEDGWKLFGDLSEEDRVATRDGGCRRVKFKKPNSVLSYDYDGKMYFQRNKRIDFCVTPDHRVFTQKRSNKDYRELRLERVEDVIGRKRVYDTGFEWKGEYREFFILPSIINLRTGPKVNRVALGQAVSDYKKDNGTYSELSKKYGVATRTIRKYVSGEGIKPTSEGRGIREKKIPMTLWVRFLGWYLSEGYVVQRKNRPSNYAVGVCQKPSSPHFKKLESIMTKLASILGRELSRIHKENGVVVFIVRDKQLASYLDRFGKAVEKYIPQEIKNLDRELLKPLLTALLAGDGWKHGRGYRYFSISKRLADDVQEVALKCGYGAIVREKDEGYITHICQTPRVHTNHGKQTDGFRHYKGRVYDVDVGEDGIVFVRRNGKPVWSGNCPNMPIPEGFFRVKHEGMEDILPFPRQGHSVYHVSKIQTTDNVWFATRTWVMKVTDVHQGVVVGTQIDEMGDDPRLKTRFDIDESFGTVVNRFAACAVSGHPIPVYGSGCQTRGYLSLRDSMQCLTLAIENPPTYDDSFHGHRVINQFSKTYSVNDLAQMVKQIGEKKFGLEVGIEHIENPRIEPEIHYYAPKSEKLRKLGFKEEYTLEETVEEMIGDLLPHKDRIMVDKIRPRVRWRDRQTYKSADKKQAPVDNTEEVRKV